jgi:predicted nucleic acid-binding protein
MSVLVDTGGILAIINRRDQRHRSVMAFITSTDEALLVPITVLPEVDYLLTQRIGAHAAISALASIVSGDFRLELMLQTDFPRTLELMRQYADSNIGFVDASMVAIAERLNIRRILTVDRRHFGLIRPRHCPALDILP